MCFRFILIAVFMLSSAFAEEPRNEIFSKLVFDPQQDFSVGHFDLENYLITEEKPCIAADNYEKCVSNFRKVVTSISTKISEDILARSSLPDLLTEVVFLIGEQGEMISSQCYTLNAFLSEEKIELDCDTTTFTVYSILHRVQKAHPHYQILENFYLSHMILHTLGAIYDRGKFFYVDLNVKLPRGVKLLFWDKRTYLELRDIKNAGLIPVKGEALKGDVLMAGVLNDMQEKHYESALLKLHEVLEWDPAHIYAIALRGACEFWLGSFKESAETLKSLEQHEELPDKLSLLLGMAYYKMGKYGETIGIMDQVIEEAGEQATLVYHYLLRAEARAVLSNKFLEGMSSQEKDLTRLITAVGQERAEMDYAEALSALADPYHKEVRALKKISSDSNKQEAFNLALEEYETALKKQYRRYVQAIKQYFEQNALNVPEVSLQDLYFEVDQKDLRQAEAYRAEASEHLKQKHTEKVNESHNKAIQAYRKAAGPYLDFLKGKEEIPEDDVLMEVYRQIRTEQGPLAAEKWMTFMMDLKETQEIELEGAFETLETQVALMLPKETK